MTESVSPNDRIEIRKQNSDDQDAHIVQCSVSKQTGSSLLDSSVTTTRAKSDEYQKSQEESRLKLFFQRRESDSL
jgi:hypothetical protein